MKPLVLMNNGENVCFFNHVMQVLYLLPLSGDCINQLKSAEGVAMQIKNLFREIETSKESVRTSQYVRYLNLLGYESGMQYDAHECLLQLLLNIYLNISDDCMFKIEKLKLTLCNKCGHTANTNDVCIDTSLHLEDSSNVETISGMLHQLIEPRGEYLENYRCDGCQRWNTSTKAVYVT